MLLRRLNRRISVPPVDEVYLFLDFIFIGIQIAVLINRSLLTSLQCAAHKFQRLRRVVLIKHKRTHHTVAVVDKHALLLDLQRITFYISAHIWLTTGVSLFYFSVIIIEIAIVLCQLVRADWVVAFEQIFNKALLTDILIIDEIQFFTVITAPIPLTLLYITDIKKAIE